MSSWNELLVRFRTVKASDLVKDVPVALLADTFSSTRLHRNHISRPLSFCPVLRLCGFLQKGNKDTKLAASQVCWPLPTAMAKPSLRFVRLLFAHSSSESIGAKLTSSSLISKLRFFLIEASAFFTSFFGRVGFTSPGPKTSAGRS